MDLKLLIATILLNCLREITGIDGLNFLRGLTNVQEGLFNEFNGAARGVNEGFNKAEGVVDLTGSTVTDGPNDGAKADMFHLPDVGDVLKDMTTPELDCNSDIIQEYRKAIFGFTMRLFGRMVSYKEDHFAISPLSIWISLAAIAEGADGVLQKELFTALSLPELRCLREKYYMIALSREKSGNDIRFMRRRMIVMDQDLRVNSTWSNLANNLLDISYASIRSNPQEVSNQLRDFIGARFAPRLSTNSVLLDSLSYEGFWTTAFSSVEIAPFYSEDGEVIGRVEYMKVKKRVKLSQVPTMSAKVLELPIGDNGRYNLKIVVGLSQSILSGFDIFMKVIKMLLGNLKESPVALEVAIPRFVMDYEWEANLVLNDLGVGSIWKNPETTWLISYPPAQPSGLYQRVSFKLDSKGLLPAENPDPSMLNPIEGMVHAASDVATGLASAAGEDFIANRPFMYGLFDSETDSCIFAGAYSKPQ